MSRSSEELRDALAKELLDRIELGEKDSEGKLSPPSPALINAAINFLKLFPPKQGETIGDPEVSERLQKFKNVAKFRGRGN